MDKSDISITMNVYTHIKFEDAKNELEKISAKENEEKITLVDLEALKKELEKIKVV